MGEANDANINDIRLSLDLIRSARPEDRMRGIAILSQMKSDPRVVQVFQILYRDDPDLRVRTAAWNALNPQGASLPSVPLPMAVQPPPASQMPAGHQTGPFLANPANARIIARFTRKSRRGRRIIWTMIGVALLLSGIFWGMVLPDWWRWYQLSANGVTTKAVITSLQERGKGRHIVTYRFEVGDPEDENAAGYSGEWRAVLGEFRNLEEDDLVPVVYLPSDPTISRLDMRSPDITRRLRRSLAAIALTLLAVFLMLYDLHRRRTTRPSRLIRGEVVSCTGHMSEDGNYHIKLHYRFSTPKGQPVSGQITRTRNDLKNRGLPTAGTPIAVYYKGQRSYRVL